MKYVLELSTSRLILVGAESALLLAEQSSRAALAAAFEATVPTQWPPEHHDRDVIAWILKSLDMLGSGEPWRMFYIVLRDPRTLIGTCGFKGPPDLNGGVEVGYTILQDFHCRGLATEAVLKLISIAFDQEACEVAAETYPSLPASIRVMEKCGMTLAGTCADAGTVRYRVKHPR